MCTLSKYLGGRVPKAISIKNEGLKLVTWLPKNKVKGSKWVD